MNLTIADILDATGGRLMQGDPAAAVSGVSTDSRTVRPGELFIALPGEDFDGHDFVAGALRAGARAAAVSRWPSGLATRRAVVLVESTVAAYGALAAWWRARLPARVVGVTGSNGKTTVKDMIAQLLGPLGATLNSEGNHNNHIGVPETLLRMRPHHRYAVVEMGTNHPGEIEALARLVRPHVGVITNIGPTHLEAFGSEEGVAREKARLLGFLEPGGLAVLHADDRWSRRLGAERRGAKATFGLTPGADWRAVEIATGEESVRFVVERFGEAFTVPVVGRYQVANCLAAIAVAHEMGLSVPEAAACFEDFRPPKWRMNLQRIGAVTLLVDCYNANPASMRAAIEELAGRPARGRRVAVLGDMLELGASSDTAHRGVGRLAALAGLDLLCAVGELSEPVAGEARCHGMDETKVFWTGDRAAAARWVCERLRPNDTVLFKASRGIRLEEVGSAVVAWARSRAASAATRPRAGRLAPAALAALAELDASSAGDAGDRLAPS
jgi:UDP-N-acetylmuramoyl-tripeptide--D-alanyl-D-alanine ligase